MINFKSLNNIITNSLTNINKVKYAVFSAELVIDIFEKEYPNHLHLVPYYWMPKYILSDDPSARTLANYK